jgi:hypothetical protein
MTDEERIKYLGDVLTKLMFHQASSKMLLRSLMHLYERKDFNAIVQKHVNATNLAIGELKIFANKEGKSYKQDLYKFVKILDGDIGFKIAEALDVLMLYAEEERMELAIDILRHVQTGAIQIEREPEIQTHDNRNNREG